MQINLFVHTF